MKPTISAGIDVGTKSVKVVVLEDGRVAVRAVERTGFDPTQAASRALASALQRASLSTRDVTRTVATGSWLQEVDAARTITEVTAVARGIHELQPGVRTVLDVGAEEARAIRVGEGGRVLDFVINEKCASGTGAFLEAVACAIEVDMGELGRISLRSERSVPMNAQCVVFAESEVVGLVHADTPKEDIARAVHDAVASRIASMARRVRLEPQVALVGGMALNVGFRASLERVAEMALVIPEHPEYVGALGAALVAAGKE